MFVCFVFAWGGMLYAGGGRLLMMNGAVPRALLTILCPSFPAHDTRYGQAEGKRPPARKALSRRPDRVAESAMLGNGIDGRPARAVNQEHAFGHVPGIPVGFKCAALLRFFLFSRPRFVLRLRPLSCVFLQRFTF